MPEIADAPRPHVQRMQLFYERLDMLLKARFVDNPKLHARDLIEYSVRKYGFNNPVLFDYQHEMLTAGHGRLEGLEGMMIAYNLIWENIRKYEAMPDGMGDADAAKLREQPAAKLPDKIDLDPDDGMWLIPTAACNFDDEETAIGYILMDNRTATMSYRPEDYDAAKMKRALAKAQGNLAQAALPGFEDVEAGGLEQFQLPEGQQPYEPYDPTKIEGAPAYAPNLKEAFVLMVACPTHEDLRKTLFYLSGGQRKYLRKEVKHSGMDCTQWYGVWKNLTGGAEPPENIAEDASAEAAVTPEGSIPAEPAWVGGLCPTCGGGGSTGRRQTLTGYENIQCTYCDGYGDQDKWRAHYGGAGATVKPLKEKKSSKSKPKQEQMVIEEPVEPEYMIAATPEPVRDPDAAPLFEIGD